MQLAQVHLHPDQRPVSGLAPGDASPVSLDAWPLRTPAVLQGFAAVADTEVRRALHRLAEIGFLPGEPLEVVARAGGRGGPIAVRVGSSTFALRAHEAALLRVKEPV